MQKLELSDEHFCMICGKKMEMHHYIDYADYVCRWQEDHHLSYRVKENWMTKLRVRFTDEDGQHLRLKIHYDHKYSEVWTTPKSQRLKIDHIIVPDFTRIDVLKNKIKTCLVFG